MSAQLIAHWTHAMFLVSLLCMLLLSEDFHLFSDYPNDFVHQQMTCVCVSVFQWWNEMFNIKGFKSIKQYNADKKMCDN